MSSHQQPLLPHQIEYPPVQPTGSGAQALKYLYLRDHGAGRYSLKANPPWILTVMALLYAMIIVALFWVLIMVASAEGSGRTNGHSPTPIVGFMLGFLSFIFVMSFITAVRRKTVFDTVSRTVKSGRKAYPFDNVTGFAEVPLFLGVIFPVGTSAQLKVVKVSGSRRRKRALVIRLIPPFRRKTINDLMAEIGSVLGRPLEAQLPRLL